MLSFVVDCSQDRFWGKCELKFHGLVQVEVLSLLTEETRKRALYMFKYTGLFISPSGFSELDCATTKTNTAERSISIGRESLQGFFFVLGALAYFQVPPLGGSREKNGVYSE